MSPPVDLLASLEARLATVSDLGHTLSLLEWDQQTHLPPAAAAVRAEQVATLSRILHEHSVAPELGELLGRLEGELDPETDEGALVRVARRDFDRATRLPAALVERTARATSLAEPAWIAARQASDWALFAPHLETVLALRREAAELYGYDEHPLDALIDLHEPGMTKARLEGTFAELQAALVPLVRAVAAAADDDRDACLHGRFDEAAQEAFGREVAGRLGYDWNRGRQDRAVHPFCTGLGPDDVRITTRFDATYLPSALFSTLHEAGHGIYEQSVSPAYARSPLGDGASTGVHESQSRLWENLVGRSRPFWQAFFPELRAAFPASLGGVDLETFYRAINRAAPSTIRVEADELTYNLHILLRFELETRLFEGSLSVAELPAAWTERMEAYLGVTPPDDREGALQDIHWSSGAFGYFPTYTIGNVLSVQLFEAARAEHPEIDEEIGRGEPATLRAWLTEHVYRHGRKYDPDDLVTRATGRPMETGPYLAYLETKYGELYEL